jgi:hypothetical protein
MKATLIFLLFSIFAFNAEAHVRTNVNEVTDLFEKNIDNKEQEFKVLQKNNDDALDNISSEGGYQYIQGMDKDVNGKISELNSIRDTDLDNAGREKRHSDEYKFYDEGQFEPDYTRPGNKMHREDAMTIAIGTRKTLDALLTELHNIGVDCKTIKGPKQKEAKFFIDIQRAAQKNTEYDLFLCEELRNQYQCDDSVALTCKTKGINLHPWQRKTFDFNGHEIRNNWFEVFYSRKIKKKHFRHYIHNNPTTKVHFRNVLAQKHGVTAEHISTDNWAIENLDHYVNPYKRAWGGVHIGGKGYIYPTYRIHYDYRTSNEICEEWSEDWTERCTIK